MTEKTPEEILEEWHPLALGVIAELSKDSEDAKNLDISDELLAEIHDELRALFGSEELVYALRSLLRLCASLYENGSEAAAEKLAVSLESAELIEAMAELNRQQDLDLEKDRIEKDAHKKAAQVVGQDGKKLAPKEGEEAPEGSVRADKLDFPKRA